jgi:hypothetical protein
LLIALFGFLMVVPVLLGLWHFRDDITSFHLQALVWAGAAAVLFIGLFQKDPTLKRLGLVVLGLVAVALVAAFLLKNMSGGRSVRNADKSQRMRTGRRDLGRTYAVPQIILILLGFNLGKSILGPMLLAGAALFAGMSWIHAQKRLRAIRNTPPSRIASAAQGRVELSGVGRPLGAKALFTPLRGRPCIWFFYKIEQKRGDKWRELEVAASEEPFVLEDDSGTCVVEPAHAQVDAEHHSVWRDGDRRYTERWIAPGARVYALGQFVSENRAAIGRSARREIGELLAQWKQDPRALRARFDSNRDGELSLEEWQVAQREATAKVQAEHAQINALPATHYLRAPPDRSAFLISDKREGDVTSKARRSAMLRMAWFGVVLTGTVAATTNTARKASRRTDRSAPR